jgi:hypothetical protein
VVDAGVRAIQDPEPVLAALNAQDRLDLAVDEELVPEEAVVVEGVVGEEAVAVEEPVLEDQPDVEVAARQPERRRRVRLVTGVERVEVEGEAGEAAVDVLRGDVDGVVVVPVRRVLVLQAVVRRPVREVVVARLPEAEGVQGVAVVLRVLEPCRWMALMGSPIPRPSCARSLTNRTSCGRPVTPGGGKDTLLATMVGPGTRPS